MKKTKRFFGARAVMTLLLAMLTTMTAWADDIVYTVTLSGSLPDGVTGVAMPNLAAENETVTLSFSGVPEGKVPDLNITYNFYGNDYPVYELKDNGDGTFSFSMPNGNVTVNCGSDWKDDIKLFTATVPDQMTNNSLIWYNFETANYNPTSSVIGETVTKDNTKLVLGTDYEFKRVTYANGDSGDPDKVGDECFVEIQGMGNYGGSLYAPFTIVNPSGNGTWGDEGELTWNFADGTLSITLTNPENGNKSMNEPAPKTSYPWIQYAGYISTISIGEGITSIGKEAFGGAVYQESTYRNLTDISLPSTLTAIGSRAFYYSRSLSLIIPASVTTIGSEAFQSVASVTASLSDADNNSTLISRLADATTANVTISGRTLSKSGEWNTLCLPFSMDATQIAASDLAEATIMELDNAEGATSLSDAGVLTLKFNTVTAIEAGKPYIVKWDGTSGSVNDPAFSGVTITSTTPTAVKSYDNKVTFVGQYSPFKIGDVTNGDDGNKNEIIMLGANNELGYSNNARSLKCFRAHFYVKSDGSEQAARAFVLDFDDETTSLSEELRVKSEEFATAAEWYSMDGRKLNSMPTQKGIYIVNGKKIVIK